MLKNRETQAIIDGLKEQQEAYEKYYDALDSLEDEEERTATREGLLRQISTLSGGVDGASKAKT